MVEIFSTENGSVYQSDKKRCFYVDFAGYLTPFKILYFISLKRRILKIDLAAMLTRDGLNDVEIIAPCGSERVYVLTAAQVIEFQLLLSGAQAMLELNGILNERLRLIAV